MQPRANAQGTAFAGCALSSGPTADDQARCRYLDSIWLSYQVRPFALSMADASAAHKHSAVAAHRAAIQQWKLRFFSALSLISSW